MFLRFINKQEAPVIQMKAIDTFELSKLPGPGMQQLLRDLRRMGLQPLIEFRKPWNNEIICQFYASYLTWTPGQRLISFIGPLKASTTRLISLPSLAFLAWTVGIAPPLPLLTFPLLPWMSISICIWMVIVLMGRQFG